jgi:AcrR family transcriptional regulator/ribosomal protein S18 acetylase RimI-like enzyme
MSEKKAGVNKAIQSERRRLLIDATMSAIYEHGLNDLTLAKIAREAGLSAGSVNFHFDSKEALLLETLTYLAEEFEQGIDLAIEQAPPSPAEKLLALMEAYLGPNVTEPRKMAVWNAFSTESRSRADYHRICGPQDQKILDLTHRLCRDIIREGKREKQMHALAMANAVQGLMDEIWQEILFAGDSYDREQARYLYMSFLASVFPWSFHQPNRVDERKAPLSTDDRSLRIVTAGEEQLPQVARLFDLYRQFYDQPSNPKLARRFIGNNLRKQRSIIFLAVDSEGRELGFTQLYPSWCSVAAAPLMTLYDLYVDQSARQRGVARALMAAAEKAAKKAKACRIDLETEINNHRAQALYEDLGYQREVEFFKYSLELDA